MKASIQVANFTWPGGDASIAPNLRTIAEASEAAGFDTLWVMDHFFQLEPMIGPADNAMLEALLDAGSNIDEFDAKGRNAGWYAADAGSVQNIALLGNAGADLKLADNFGDTPLHRAATRGYAGTVRALSGVGALTDDQNEKGLSAIMLAAIYGWPEVVDILLSAGHDLERKNLDGNTALHICVQRGDALGVQYLLASRADPNAVNGNRMNAFDIAERLGHKTVLAVLKKR